jgi:hypothetical protein
MNILKEEVLGETKFERNKELDISIKKYLSLQIKDIEKQYINYCYNDMVRKMLK